MGRVRTWTCQGPSRRRRGSRTRRAPASDGAINSAQKESTQTQTDGPSLVRRRASGCSAGGHGGGWLVLPSILVTARTPLPSCALAPACAVSPRAKSAAWLLRPARTTCLPSVCAQNAAATCVEPPCMEDMQQETSAPDVSALKRDVRERRDPACRVQAWGRMCRRADAVLLFTLKALHFVRGFAICFECGHVGPAAVLRSGRACTRRHL